MRTKDSLRGSHRVMRAVRKTTRTNTGVTSLRHVINIQKGRSRVLNLLLSSLIAGTVGTLVVLAIYFVLPFYRVVFRDFLGALSSLFTRTEGGGSPFVGGIIFLIGGILIAALYGWGLLEFAQVDIPRPVDEAGTGLVPNRLTVTLIGVHIGLAQGVPFGFLFFILMTQYRAAERERNRIGQVLVHLLSHAAFGGTVMFLHTLFLW